MAGVPHHALDGYLAKLVAQQRIVALAEQLDPPVPEPPDAARRRARRDARNGHRGASARTHAQQLSGGRDGGGRRDRRRPRRRLDGPRGGDGFSSGPFALDEALAELARLEPAEIVADVPAEMREAIGAVERRRAGDVARAGGGRDARTRGPRRILARRIARDAPRARCARGFRPARRRVRSAGARSGRREYYRPGRFWRSTRSASVISS